MLDSIKWLLNKLKEDSSKAIAAWQSIVIFSILAGYITFYITSYYYKNKMNIAEGVVQQKEEHIQVLKDTISGLERDNTNLQSNKTLNQENIDINPDGISQDGQVVATAFGVNIIKSEGTVQIERITAEGDFNFNREMQWRKVTFQNCSYGTRFTNKSFDQIKQQNFESINCTLK